MVKEQRLSNKIVRRSFAKIDEALGMPNLIDVQKKSYKWFLEEGLSEVLREVSPIYDHSENLCIEFVDFTFDFIDTNDIVAEFRQADPRRQTDITGSDDSNFHFFLSFIHKSKFWDLSVIINKPPANSSPEDFCAQRRRSRAAVRLFQSLLINNPRMKNFQPMPEKRTKKRALFLLQGTTLLFIFFSVVVLPGKPGGNQNIPFTEYPAEYTVSCS